MDTLLNKPTTFYKMKITLNNHNRTVFLEMLNSKFFGDTISQVISNMLVISENHPDYKAWKEQHGLSDAMTLVEKQNNQQQN